MDALAPSSPFKGDTSLILTRKWRNTLFDDHDSDSLTNLLDPLVVTKDTFADLSYTMHDPLFPAENAYDRLLTLLKSNAPWKVTPKLLFCICHILEESLPFCLSVTPGPNHRTLLPVLRKMRTWRLEERQSLEGLASDLAGLVDVELLAKNDNFEWGITLKASNRIVEDEDKENVSSYRKESLQNVRTPKNRTRGQTPSLNDLLGEPVSFFRRECAACDALRSTSKSRAALQKIQQILHHTHDHENNSLQVAFPRPPPPSSSLHSRSRPKNRTPLLPKTYQAIDPESTVVDAAALRPRRALTSLNGRTPSHSPIPPDNGFQIFRSMRNTEDLTDFSVDEVWIKRRSQEEGWRP